MVKTEVLVKLAAPDPWSFTVLDALTRKFGFGDIVEVERTKSWELTFDLVSPDAAVALQKARVPLVITPHPGEAARLLGTSAKDVQTDRQGAAMRLVGLGTVAVLKGAGTVVCDGRRIYVNETGNPGMATAGSGDVLTGLTAALMASGMEPFSAAVLAVWAHGRAGDLAAERMGVLGLTALDILGCLPEVLRLQ